MSDIFVLITPLFKPNNHGISEEITPVLPLMTNECERSQNYLFNVFPQENVLNMEGYHHIQGNTKFGERGKSAGGTAGKPMYLCKDCWNYFVYLMLFVFVRLQRSCLLSSSRSKALQVPTIP